MAERPILFSAPMVRAILAGTKTQTRRAMKPQPWARPEPEDGLWRLYAGDEGMKPFPCPYGKPGDWLWVKETWRPRLLNNGYPGAPDLSDVSVEYAADGELRIYADDEIDQANPDWSMPKAAERGNVSPLFMPRWASRITLEVTDVRVQRLQDISGSDARAEGVERIHCYGPDCPDGEDGCNARGCYGARERFHELWDSINGAGAWDANPWVWAVSFQRVAP